MEIILTHIFGEAVGWVCAVIYAFWMLFGLMPYMERYSSDPYSNKERIYLVFYFINLGLVILGFIIWVLIRIGAIVIV